MSHGHHPPAQAVMAALSLAAQLAGHRQSAHHAQAIEAMRHGALAHMVDVLVAGRVDTVQRGFHEVLQLYAEQARHFMAQQKEYSDKELDSSDPLRRIELRSRIHKIDAELANLRADAKLMFDRMSEVVLALGGAPGMLAGDGMQPLMLEVV